MRIEMSRSDDYPTENLLDFSYHQNYKLIRVDFPRYIYIIGTDLANTNIPQRINFSGKTEEDDGAKMFFIDEKQHKTILRFSLDSLIVTE